MIRMANIAPTIRTVPRKEDHAVTFSQNQGGSALRSHMRGP